MGKNARQTGQTRSRQANAAIDQIRTDCSRVGAAGTECMVPSGGLPLEDAAAAEQGEEFFPSPACLRERGAKRRSGAKTLSRERTFTSITAPLPRRAARGPPPPPRRGGSR